VRLQRQPEAKKRVNKQLYRWQMASHVAALTAGEDEEAARW